jgi:hypothetical protein
MYKEVLMTMTKKEAVQYIARINSNGVTQDAVNRGLRDGSEPALTRALIEARQFGTQLAVVETANEALGFPRGSRAR